LFALIKHQIEMTQMVKRVIQAPPAKSGQSGKSPFADVQPSLHHSQAAINHKEIYIGLMDAYL